MYYSAQDAWQAITIKKNSRTNLSNYFRDKKYIYGNIQNLFVYGSFFYQTSDFYYCTINILLYTTKCRKASHFTLIKISCSKPESKSVLQYQSDTCGDVRQTPTLQRAHVHGRLGGETARAGTQITTWSDSEARMTVDHKLNETRPT